MENKYDDKITSVLEDNSFVSSFHFNLDSGYGNMIFYHLFEGIDLVYNDFYAENCNQIDDSSGYDNYIIINHCNRGRFETIFNDKYMTLDEIKKIEVSSLKMINYDIFPSVIHSRKQN